MRRREIVGNLGVLGAGALLAGESLAQRPGQGGGGRPQMSSEEWQKRIEQMVERRLEQAGVTPEQMPKVKEALKAKQEARGPYMEKIRALREKTEDPFVSDADLLAGLKTCREAQAAYEQAAKEQDHKIIAFVSPMAQAKLFLTGLIDNGLGMMGGGRRPGGGRQTLRPDRSGGARNVPVAAVPESDRQRRGSSA